MKALKVLLVIAAFTSSAVFADASCSARSGKSGTPMYKKSNTVAALIGERKAVKPASTVPALGVVEGASNANHN